MDNKKYKVTVRWPIKDRTSTFKTEDMAYWFWRLNMIAGRKAWIADGSHTETAMPTKSRKKKKSVSDILNS